MTETEHTLDIEGYTLSYRTKTGQFRVLEDIDLDIERGEVVGLVGESGSGKSTIANAVMRAIQGEIAAEDGTIALAGTDLGKLTAGDLANIRGNRIAMVFQDPGGSLNPTLPLGRHVIQVLRRHRAMNEAEATRETARLIEMVGLADPELMMTKYPHEVSGGEKQRLVIALAYACDPDLILFDEPTSSLDATTATNILDLFRELQGKTGVSALFISHDLGTVAEIAHRVAVIYAGHIVEVATTEDLFHQPRHPYTRALMASLPKPLSTDSEHDLVSLPGSLPPRDAPMVGCVFANRCPFAAEKCREGTIVIGTDGKDQATHRTACIRWRDVMDLPLLEETIRKETRDRGEAQVPILEVSDLSVQIGKHNFLDRMLGKPPSMIHALSNVSIKINPGETLGLVGESGCGKSTLARALTALREFDGEIHLEGRSIKKAGDIDHQYRSRLQIIFQNPDFSLNPRQKISTILSRPLKLYENLSGAGLRKAIDNLMEQVNLPIEFAERYPHQLSGGEKQRIAIARALAAKPSVIVCDEVTSGLDASVQASITNLLRDIQRTRGIAFLFITHDLNLLSHIADRVVVMYLGQIVETRSATGINTPPYHPYTEALLSSAPVLDPDVDVRRVRLQGAIPSRVGELKGCPFESRCPKRLGDICLTTDPPELVIGKDQTIRCHIDQQTLDTTPPIWIKRVAV
jgi:oligopeptide/dipeptide ABC transporter ATP-binding protein